MNWVIGGVGILILNVLIVAWFARKKPVDHAPDMATEKKEVDDDLEKKIDAIKSADNSNVLDMLRKLRK